MGLVRTFKISVLSFQTSTYIKSSLSKDVIEMARLRRSSKLVTVMSLLYEFRELFSR